MIREISKPKLRKPIFIAAWPGMGEVAYRSVLFLKEALEFKVFAKLEARDFFPLAGIVVKQGALELPSMPAGFFYYYKAPRKQNIILFIGDAQPPLEHGEALAEAIIDFVKKYKPQHIFSFAAKPEAIDHKTKPNVWIAATDKDFADSLKHLQLKPLEEGQVSGLNGLILGVAKRHDLPGATLLGEIPLYTAQIENPKATEAILSVIDKYAGLNLDLTPLRERGKFIEDEIERMIAYLKGEPSPEQPLDEEDIDKIKKDLAAYTKLPQSAREQIEKMFKEAQKDIAKARQLKEELDRWHVYQEYEDRFLDLFKKDKGTNIH